MVLIVLWNEAIPKINVRFRWYLLIVAVSTVAVYLASKEYTLWWFALIVFVILLNEAIPKVGVWVPRFLLLVAVILFVVAIFADKNAAKWMAAGLAVFAGAFLVSDLGPGLRRRL